MADDFWWHWCPQKNYISEPPDFSGLDPETLEPWSPRKVVELLGLQTFDDSTKLQQICEQVVADHPAQAATYRKGKTKIIGFFIQKVMAATQGGAEPRKIQQTLEVLLQGGADGSSSTG